MTDLTAPTDSAVDGLGANSVTHRTKSRPDILLTGVAVAVLLVGLALRIWIVNGSLGTLNADETLSGVMARALLDGNPSTFTGSRTTAAPSNSSRSPA